MLTTEYDFMTSEISNANVGQIRSLLRQLGSKELPDKEHLQRMARSCRLMAARRQGVIVGIASLIPIETLTRRLGFVEHVVVDTAARCQGIGKTMIQKIIEEARRLQLTRLDLTSRSSRREAHRMYLELGFKIRETCNFRLELVAE